MIRSSGCIANWIIVDVSVIIIGGVVVSDIVFLTVSTSADSGVAACHPAGHIILNL